MSCPGAGEESEGIVRVRGERGDQERGAWYSEGERVWADEDEIR